MPTRRPRERHNWRSRSPSERFSVSASSKDCHLWQSPFPHGVLQEGSVCSFEAFSERNFCGPPKRRKQRYVKQLTWSAVRLRRIEDDFAAISTDVGNDVSELRDAYVFPGSNVYELRPGVVLQQIYTRVSKIVDIEKLASWHACSPHGNGQRTGNFRFMKPADQGRYYMTVFRMIVVTRAVEICRHDGNEITSVLANICLTQLNAGNFRNCVPLIGRLKLACQQLVFAHGLFGVFRVYAGRP